MRKIIFGIRKSRLARSQLNEFIAYLESRKLTFDYSIKTIMTEADRNQVSPVQEMGRGVFVKEIEQALLRQDIDCAVHSLKDVPVEIAPGSKLACFAPRQDVRDCLIAGENISVENLRGLRVGTGCPRREAFLKEIEPDLEVLPLRGNVDTRVSKMAAGAYDAVVLAACGLQRLEQATMIRRSFDPDTFVPAAGQGTICGQIRGDDAALSNAFKSCSCVDTEIAALAERKVLKELEVGCQKPFGVYARFENDEFIITAKAYLEKNLTYIYERRKCLRVDSEKAASELIEAMKAKIGLDCL